jgi:hypothetical protein
MTGPGFRIPQEGGPFPAAEIWNPDPRIPSTPDVGRVVGFAVRDEIRYKDYVAIRGAREAGVRT